MRLEKNLDDLLVALCHHCWTLPALAALASGGAKFVTLRRRLGASDGALRDALASLVARDWVRRNPGYGHPLRPEYLLTGIGQEVAARCAVLVERVRAERAEEVAFRKWSLPVLSASRLEEARYSAIRRRLAGITDRALTKSLRDLEAVGWVKRRIVDAAPPAVEYDPTAGGLLVARLTDEMLATAVATGR